MKSDLEQSLDKIKRLVFSMNSEIEVHTSTDPCPVCGWCDELWKIYEELEEYAGQTSAQSAADRLESATRASKRPEDE